MTGKLSLVVMASLMTAFAGAGRDDEDDAAPVTIAALPASFMRASAAFTP